MSSRYLFLLMTVVFVVSCSEEKNSNYATLYGIVTDFDGNPIDSASVKIKDRNFNNLYETVTDKKGRYYIKVKKDIYPSVFVIREDEYAKTKLEYWAWNVPVLNNLELNCRYGKIEIYGVNVFEPKVNPYDTYRIYFRPMSLGKYLTTSEIKKGDTIAIAPRLIKNDITVTINGIETGIKTLDRVLEYSSAGNYIFAYEMQVLKPDSTAISASQKTTGFDKISVFIHSSETGEKGEADYFYKQNED
ncbi:MAG: carboxypeptidase regulatory-like domain-containing protein [Chlorobi bacterium]|nr:carboxypeptidase regulatory-like domain-containing protein [Chlorobiota bacterium]